MGTPKNRKKRVRVCDKCGDKKTIRADNASSTCRSCATRIQNEKSKVGKRNTKHGMTGTRTYQTWQQMVARCTSPIHHKYSSYGARQINVCADWLKFENFYKDMGDKPRGGSIHRIDNNRGYSPDNCVWMDWRAHDRLHRLKLN